MKAQVGVGFGPKGPAGLAWLATVQRVLVGFGGSRCPCRSDNRADLGRRPGTGVTRIGAESWTPGVIPGARPRLGTVSDMSEDNDRSSTAEAAPGVAVGLALGVGLGLAFGNLALGIALGIALGAAFGAAKAQRQDQEDV